MGRHDVGVLLARAAEWEAQAARDSENLAMLLDRDDYWLNSEYAQWTTDPDDPEVKAAREQRKRAGIKPPPQPLIAPVALRPDGIGEIRRKQYTDALAANAPKTGGLKISSAADFKRLLGAR